MEEVNRIGVENVNTLITRWWSSLAGGRGKGAGQYFEENCPSGKSGHEAWVRVGACDDLFAWGEIGSCAFRNIL